MGDAALLFANRFHTSRDSVLLVSRDGRRHTYGEVWAGSCELAAKWRGQGVKPGDAVAIGFVNDPVFLYCYVACIIGGFVAVPINFELTPDDIAFILSLVTPTLVLREPPTVETDAAETAAFSVATDPRDVCAIFFTSGTTGRPKGVRHSLAALVGNVVSFNSITGLGEHTCLYHVLPMAYMAGFLNTFLSPVMAGGTVVIGPRFSPQTALDFWSRPQTEGANAVWLSPSIAAALCRVVRDIAAVRQVAAGFSDIFCGTAPLHPVVRRDFHDTFGQPLQESYGTSELLLVSVQDRKQALVGAEHVGRPLVELELAFRPDEEGLKELFIRSPFEMRGYLTEKGCSSPSRDGWMSTGDIGAVIDGNLHITGRIKDLIIRGGVNIAPRALEDAVGDVPGVLDVAVIGLPHEFWGESVVLCVEAAGDVESSALETAIRQRCRKAVARSHQPDRIVVLRSFPRAVTDKVQKHLLKQRLAE